MVHRQTGDGAEGNLERTPGQEGTGVADSAFGTGLPDRVGDPDSRSPGRIFQRRRDRHAAPLGPGEQRG